MKSNNVPPRLSASDDDIARLFSTLDDAPSQDAEAAIHARLEAAARGEGGEGRASSVRFGLRTALIGGVLATALMATFALRGAPRDPASEAPEAPVATARPDHPGSGPRPGPTVELPAAEPSTPGIAVEDLPVAPAERVAPPPSSATKEAKDSFREQLAVVESARHALLEERAGECLTILQGYDRKYPAGLFFTEVQVMRIEALVGAGRKEEARGLAKALLASDPRGAYAGRLRSLFPNLDGTDR